jgi:copper chaperone
MTRNPGRRLTKSGTQGHETGEGTAGRWPGLSPGCGRATITIVSSRSIAVAGMTCDHCASAVRAEISKLPGITGVEVDVAAGTVRITGDPLPGDTPLREAIEEAGFEFAG